MSTVLLSFCIPTYNRPERIYKILKQILVFKSEEIEVVIGDDNPLSEKTQEVISKFKDSRIIYYKNKKNLGMDANMLKTIRKALGEFVFIQMDDDDIEMESVPWILKEIKKNKNLTHIFGTIGDKRSNHNDSYFKCVYQNYLDKTINKSPESLIKLLFHYHHGSGAIFKKKILDLKLAMNYCGFLWMHQALIAQALVKGDVLCTSREISHIGKDTYPSGHTSINEMHPIKVRIQIILDVTKQFKERKIIRKKLINRQKEFILYYFNLYKSLKSYIKAISVILTMRKVSHSISFWIFLMLNILYKYVKKFRKISWFFEIFNKFHLMA